MNDPAIFIPVVVLGAMLSVGVLVVLLWLASYAKKKNWGEKQARESDAISQTESVLSTPAPVERSDFLIPAIQGDWVKLRINTHETLAPGGWSLLKRVYQVDYALELPAKN